MPSRIVPLYLDIRFNAHPHTCGGELFCPDSIPPRAGEGIFWVDPKTQKLALWHIQRVEYYCAVGYPKDRIPKLSKAAGAVWLDRIADAETGRPSLARGQRRRLLHQALGDRKRGALLLTRPWQHQVQLPR